jgi:hypothetical protein
MSEELVGGFDGLASNVVASRNGNLATRTSAAEQHGQVGMFELEPSE